MQLIYVAHPYGGRRDNFNACHENIDKLQQLFPGVTFVAGVTSIGGNYDETPYRVGMAHCLELLSRCDAIIMTGAYMSSVGCQAEEAFAEWRGIKIYENTAIFIEAMKGANHE
ncbi:MAG: DUF4406 domain-containing protein [Acidaminococcaceae bacterium]|jgi:hypothetical protein|nr:DUF4406 domain-containing protein [Acidaminococcaceae bacterium]